MLNLVVFSFLAAAIALPVLIDWVLPPVIAALDRK
jgi:hypothetical protein